MFRTLIHRAIQIALAAAFALPLALTPAVAPVFAADSGPSRISFARGATSGSVDGSIASRRTNTYILWAAKDQTMTVTATSKDSVALTVYGLTDGQPLVRANGAGVSSWSGKLPANQDYVINVVPGVDTTTFTLTVTIK